MGLFARDAPWIRRIFPPSVTPGVAQPLAVSEDVQLTHDYLAHGQLQRPSIWLNRFDFANPGQDAAVTIIDPRNNTTMPPAAIEAEVWRVMFVSVQITASPVGDFSFELEIQQLTPTPIGVTISERRTIFNAQSNPVAAWPVIGVQTLGIDVTTHEGGGFSYAGPLLLPVDPTSDTQGPFLSLRQRTAQAGASETLRVTTYIQRNQAGVAHIL